MAEGWRSSLLSITLWFFINTMYLCLGMAIFVAIETEKTNEVISQKTKMRASLKAELKNKLNMSQAEFDELMKKTVEAFSVMPTKWNYVNAFAFVLQTVTTIGYGYIIPATTSGRLFCVFYALFGIPLAALLLQATGSAISLGFRTLIVKIETKVRKSTEVKYANMKSFIGSFILLIVVILLFAAVYFDRHDHDSFIEGIYAWFITLTTIGYGDVVPGQNSDNLAMIWLRVVFMFFGLSITASILSSMSAWIGQRNTTICKCCSGVTARWTKRGNAMEVNEEAIGEGSYRRNSIPLNQTNINKHDVNTTEELSPPSRTNEL